MQDPVPVVLPLKCLGIDPNTELRALVCPFCLDEVVAGTLLGAIAWGNAHIQHCPAYRINALRFSVGA
jgi:hypothetical protein